MKAEGDGVAGRPGRSRSASPLPERWLEVTLPAPPRGRAVEVGEALRHMGARALERKCARVVAHFPAPDDPDALVGRIRRVLDHVDDPASGDSGPLRWRWHTHADHAAGWRSRAAVHRISARLAVAPPDTAVPGGSQVRVIRIEPGPAFGSGDHPTTRGSLALLEHAVSRGDVMLDVGTGSGVLAIAGALLGARKVVAVDRDALACAAARQNAALNHVADRIQVLCSEAAPGRRLPGGHLNGLTANLRSGAIVELFPSFEAALGRRGWLLLSGIPQGDRTGILDLGRQHGFREAAARRVGGWWSGLLRR